MNLEYAFNKVRSADPTDEIFEVSVDTLQTAYKDLLKQKNLVGDIPDNWHYAHVRPVVEYALSKLKKLVNSTDANTAFEIAITSDYLVAAFEELDSFDPNNGLK